MKKKWNETVLPAMKRFLAVFALYALLPLLSGGVIGLLVFVQSQGEAEAAALMAEMGSQTVGQVVGEITKRERAPSGFYFLSPEAMPPALGLSLLRIGSSRYFEAEKEAVVPEEKKPEIVYDALPAGATPIISCDLSSPSYYINTTKYTIDLEAARSAAFPSGTALSEPLVLVLHTHGTECYFEDNTNLSDFATEGIDGYFLPESTSFRTTDPTKSVVQVGKVFVETLNSNGIPTLHCEVMHDKEDFNAAYVESAETVKAYLKQYPSIQYVVDLHRDAVVRGDAYVKSLTTIENTPTAQVMLVVGTGQNGRHPNWEQNLIVATEFKDRMDALYPTLSRSLYLRTARFNQEYLPGCMLLEVGSAANTLEEAENAARFAASAFADMIHAQ